GPVGLPGTAGQDYADPIGNAKSKGATGVLYVTASAGNAGPQRRGGDGVRYSVDRFSTDPAGADAGLPTLMLRPGAAAALFAGEKMEWAELAKAAASGAPPAGFELKPDKQFTLA